MRWGGVNMKLAKTISHKILNQSSIFDETIRVYNEALSFIIEVIDHEVDDTDVYSTKDMTNLIERFIHATKSHPTPKYFEFNQRFHKFPSYFRRAAIATAFGKVKSYRSLLENWEEEKKVALESGRSFHKKPPTKQFIHKEFPVMYKGNMFERTSATTAAVKAFVKNDWVWVDVIFRQQDLYKRGVHEWKECNPKLVKRGKKYFLNFSYEGKVDLHKEKIQNQRICAVDLGLTNSAVCSVIDANGTVLARKFIRHAREKDQLRRATNYLRKAQRQTGYASMPRYWNRINGLQKQILQDTAAQIIKFAKQHDVHTIVFEFLGKIHIPKGTYGAKRLRFKLHHWTKTGVQNKVEEMAHYEGMRISRINPRNTSKLAYDGSGEVQRSKRGDLATFQNGKQYHADLSASYNIGARYFIREIQKTMSEKAWSKLAAKVPSVAIRTKQTLASFITLRTVYSFS